MPPPPPHINLNPRPQPHTISLTSYPPRPLTYSSFTPTMLQNEPKDGPLTPSAIKRLLLARQPFPHDQPHGGNHTIIQPYDYTIVQPHNCTIILPHNPTITHSLQYPAWLPYLKTPPLLLVQFRLQATIPHTIPPYTSPHSPILHPSPCYVRVALLGHHTTASFPRPYAALAAGSARPAPAAITVCGREYSPPHNSCKQQSPPSTVDPPPLFSKDIIRTDPRAVLRNSPSHDSHHETATMSASITAFARMRYLWLGMVTGARGFPG